MAPKKEKQVIGSKEDLKNQIYDELNNYTNSKMSYGYINKKFDQFIKEKFKKSPFKLYRSGSTKDTLVDALNIAKSDEFKEFINYSDRRPEDIASSSKPTTGPKPVKYKQNTREIKEIAKPIVNEEIEKKLKIIKEKEKEKEKEKVKEKEKESERIPFQPHIVDTSESGERPPHEGMTSKLRASVEIANLKKHIKNWEEYVPQTPDEMRFKNNCIKTLEHNIKALQTKNKIEDPAPPNIPNLPNHGKEEELRKIDSRQYQLEREMRENERIKAGIKGMKFDKDNTKMPEVRGANIDRKSTKQSDQRSESGAIKGDQHAGPSDITIKQIEAIQTMVDNKPRDVVLQDFQPVNGEEVDTYNEAQAAIVTPQVVVPQPVPTVDASVQTIQPRSNPRKPIPTAGFLGGPPGTIGPGGVLNQTTLQKIQGDVETIKNVDLLTPEGEKFMKQKFIEQKQIFDWISHMTPKIPVKLYQSVERDQIAHNQDQYLISTNQKRWLEYSKSITSNKKVRPA